MNGRFDDFKYATRIRSINLWAQIIMGIAFFAGLNFLAARHYLNFDFSENGANSLSPESVAYVENLKSPVEIYAVFGSKADAADLRQARRDLRSLFSRYEYASGRKAPVKAQFVQAHIESSRAEELARRFGNDIEDMVIVSCADNYKKIPVSEFYTREEGKPDKFRGEQLITSAILNVSSGGERKIYFLKGHGEMGIKNSSSIHGLSEFAAALKSRNYVLAELDLNEAKRVPQDAGLVVIAGAQAAFLPREIDALRKYLMNDNGKVLMLLSLGSLGGLEDILYEWGIMSDDKLVLDTGGDYESSAGDLIARSFPKNPHPIAKYLVDISMPVQFGSARPVRPDMGSPIDDSLKVDEIILSSPTSWAETSYARGGVQKYDESVDLAGPLPLGMAASRVGGDALGLTIPGGRLVVYGDENFAANRWFNRLGNSKLAVNTVNWLFDENSMLNIPARQLESYSLTLSLNEITGLAWRFMILPAAVLLICLFVWLARRN